MVASSHFGVASVMMFINIASASASSSSGAPWDASLHLFQQSTIAQFNAKCLDGSAPGYYFRPASTPQAANKWKFHFQGGGWCVSPSDCYSRSLGILGSSNTWTPFLSANWPPEYAGFYGLMDSGNSSATANAFGDFNFVWIGYCDGTSFSSDATSPVMYNSTTPLYFRGRAILDGLLFELETLHGNFLSKATEALVSGTSAGGLATYLHTSYIKSRITTPGGATVKAMPDAGFFLDVGAYSNPSVHEWYNQIAQAIQPSLWNATLQGAGPVACLNAYAPRGLAAHCFFPQYLYPYLNDVDGIFILQSLYDTANLGICYGLYCDLYTNCNTSEVEAIQAYHTLLQTTIQTAQSTFTNRDGYFLTSCYQHEESCRARDWYGITIGANNNTANSTFTQWYFHGNSGGAESVHVIDVDWPGDNSCAPQGFTHGAC